MFHFVDTKLLTRVSTSGSGIFDLAKFAFYFLRKYIIFSLFYIIYNARNLIKIVFAGLLKRSATPRRTTI
jgi:hypothetical protein